MLKKTITYKTFDGEEVTEDFYFNLSKADLVELEVSKPGGLGEYLKRISASNDGNLIIQAFKELLKKSYGKRSEDGKRFLKSDELWDEFASSEAYSDLFMELVTNADSAAEFVNGIVPANLEQEIAKIEAKNEVPQTTEDIRALSNGPRTLTPAEIEAMDSDELKSGLSAGRFRL